MRKALAAPLASGERQRSRGGGPLPAAKRLWQLHEAPDPVVEAYTTGEDPALDRALLRYEALGTMAHARGLERIGILSRKECLSLRNCLRTLLRRIGFKILPSQEDVHTAVEQHLTAKLGELGRKVHAGRSRNDQVQTDLRLMLKDRLLSIHAAAVSASRAWARLGERHQKALMPGYTHLQRAMPTTAGHWAASHAEALLEGCRGLRWAFEEADACPLGSAAGFGVTLPLDRVFVARLLGFSRVQRNTLRVQTSRPRLEAAALSALALLARDLGTLSWDICLFSTAEFGFMSLDSAFTTGSSIMPQKRNPDVAELTRARAALFPGWLAQALSLGQLCDLDNDAHDKLGRATLMPATSILTAASCSGLASGGSSFSLVRRRAIAVGTWALIR